MTETTSTPPIFMSYRRNDAGGEAGRLYDDLTRAFGHKSVFMDVSGIQPGKDFRKTIDENVAQCGVLLAIIGRNWVTIPDSAGARRLNSPDDFVRLEIVSALARNIPVIPVLVQGATMPMAHSLPEPLRDLAYRNGVELTLPRWTSDIALLVAALRTYVSVTPDIADETVYATIPVDLAAPETTATNSFSKSRRHFYIGVPVVLFLIAFIFFFFTQLNAPVATSQYQVQLPFNATGIYSDGDSFDPASGIDGKAFHSFEELDSFRGELLTRHAIAFLIGHLGELNIVRPYADRPTEIQLPALRFGSMEILAIAFNGSKVAQSFYVNYNIRREQHVQSLSDWMLLDQPRFPNEYTVLNEHYIDLNGRRGDKRVGLYSYHFKLDNTVPLKSLTLPRNKDLAIFSITLIP